MADRYNIHSLLYKLSLLFGLFFYSLSFQPAFCSMDDDAVREGKGVATSSLLESSLEIIGTLVGDSGPTCFIARCYTDEDPRILAEQDRISTYLRLMGIRTILDVRGDVVDSL